MLQHVIEIADSGLIFSEVTNALVLLALLKEEGVETEQCRRVIEPILPIARQRTSSWGEPFKSTFLYWQERAGLGTMSTVGPDPNDELLKLYHTTHRVLFAGNYGRQPVQRAPFAEALRACEPTLDRHPENGDALAEILLVETMLVPRDENQCNVLRARLGALQSPDGSISMPRATSSEAVHHAACVAALAEKLFNFPPSAAYPPGPESRRGT